MTCIPGRYAKLQLSDDAGVSYEDLGGIVDVTLIYPEIATRFWDMCCGDEVHVIVDIRERELEQWLVQGDYEGDREFRKKMHAWLGEIWTEKDAIIGKTRKEHGR